MILPPSAFLLLTSYLSPPMPCQLSTINYQLGPA